MSQFDETTERIAKQYLEDCWGPDLPEPTPTRKAQRDNCHEDFREGRNSVKESLEDMAQALTQSQAHSFYCPWIERKELNPDPHDCHACEAIRMVKARGDWPLDEPTPGASGREGE